MKDLIARGNDYRQVSSLPLGDAMDISVVIPIYNRAELLENVLVGLSVQSFDGEFEVIVVDDGSDEDVRSVCDRWSDLLDVQYLRQDREGRGAGRARNAGASRARNELLVFLDADCIPSREFLAGHATWHRRARNLVVSASRRHIDRPVDAADIASAWDDLLRESGVEKHQSESATPPDDWRSLFYRRSQRLLLGDEAYRVVLGGLMSVRKSRFDEVGGFDPAFRTWGGEDTELGWRLWNNGSFVVPEDEIVVLHQRHLDLEGGTEGRQVARDQILSVMADKVPNRFYRKAPSHLFDVPRVSWIVHTADDTESARALESASKATFRDSELVMIDQGRTRGVDAGGSDRRGRVVSVADFGEAIAAARGEIVVLVDGRARFDHRLLERAMRRLDDPRTNAVRVGYKSASDRILRISDLDAVDAASGRGGLPFFALIRRRELMKDRTALEHPRTAWTGAVDRSKVDLLVTDLVEVPADAISGAGGRAPGLRDVRAAGATEIARGIKRAATRSAPRERASTEPGGDDRPGIEYIGLAGHRNLGDDAMLEAIRGLMPWANVGVGLEDPRVVMLGGGTLLNSGGYYLNKVRRVDGPNLERAVFGTGVRNFGYWGETERISDWDPFLHSALAVGVRGPDSAEQLRSWGYRGQVDVLGDPALSLSRPERVEPVDGRVVLCPVYTGGESWGEDDRAVFDAFSTSIRRLKSEGREVVIMTAHPEDDRWAIEIMRQAGESDLPYVPGYEDMDEALSLIASSDLVIGERLHAIVLAAAVGTPFVGVEYRPKLRDFVRSVGREDCLVRTDAIEDLDRVVDHATTQAAIHSQQTSELVGGFRRKQAEVAQMLREVMTSGKPV